MYGRPTRLRRGGLVATQKNWATFQGVVRAFQTKVCISTVPKMFDCVHSNSTAVKFRATVVSNLYCEVAPPLIEENDVFKHQKVVNRFVKYFYVLLRNRQSATGDIADMTQSKYSNFFKLATRIWQSTHLFVWKIFAADGNLNEL